jgi:predicted transcriptional regulator
MPFCDHNEGAMNNHSDPMFERYADLDFTDAKPVAEIPALARAARRHAELIEPAGMNTALTTPWPLTLSSNVQERRHCEADAAWRHYQETGLHVTGEEVMKWVASWGTTDELPPPECRN